MTGQEGLGPNKVFAGEGGAGAGKDRSRLKSRGSQIPSRNPFISWEDKGEKRNTDLHHHGIRKEIQYSL